VKAVQMEPEKQRRKRFVTSINLIHENLDKDNKYI